MGKIKFLNSRRYERSDGFTVFLDDDKDLNFIKLSAHPVQVITAVALKVAENVSNTYKETYGRHYCAGLPKIINFNMLDNLTEDEIKDMKKKHEKEVKILESIELIDGI